MVSARVLLLLVGVCALSFVVLSSSQEDGGVGVSVESDLNVESVVKSAEGVKLVSSEEVKTGFIPMVDDGEDDDDEEEEEFVRSSSGELVSGGGGGAARASSPTASPPVVVHHAPSDGISLADARQFSEVGDGGTPHMPSDVAAYCYPFTNSEVVSKCGKAKTNHEINAVYLPMMMEMQRQQEPEYYEKIRELKTTTGMKVYGVSYDNPNWKLIVEVFKAYPKLFAGVLLEWIGDHACVSAIRVPSEEQLQSIKSLTTDGTIRYFVREQNFTLCNVDVPIYAHQLTSLENNDEDGDCEKPTSSPEGMRRRQFIEFPSWLQPVFGCFAGAEGLCYHAMRHLPELACSTNQRYSFNPYEFGAGRMMHMLNETCHGIPAYDVYGFV